MKSSFAWTGTIDAPPRSPLAGTVIVLIVVAVLSLTMIAPGAMGHWPLAAFILLLTLAALSKDIYATHIALLALTWALLLGFIPLFRIWPFSMLMPIVVYALVVFLIPTLRNSVGWLRKGCSDAEVRRLVVTVIVVSCLALVVWAGVEQPDLGQQLKLIPQMPLWVYPFAAVAFAMFNAAMEEVIFRGIMMEALDSALGAGLMSVSLQAVAFAALHFLAGFPNGISGFFMVLLYGFMLGIVRRRSRGMFAPWLAHLAADVAIFTILAVTLHLYHGHLII